MNGTRSQKEQSDNDRDDQKVDDDSGNNTAGADCGANKSAPTPVLNVNGPQMALQRVRRCPEIFKRGSVAQLRKTGRI
jgi:hypothetical protein